MTKDDRERLTAEARKALDEARESVRKAEQDIRDLEARLLDRPCSSVCDRGLRMLLEALEKVVDRAIALLRERETRRVSFFREVVEPIHAGFRRFREDHNSTFEEVRRILTDSSQAVPAALAVVADRDRLERQTWMIFERLDALAGPGRAR